MEVDPPTTSEEPKIPEEPQRPAEDEASEAPPPGEYNYQSSISLSPSSLLDSTSFLFLLTSSPLSFSRSVISPYLPLFFCSSSLLFVHVPLSRIALPSAPEEDPVVVPTDTAVTPTEEEGFVLDPVDMTGMEEKRVKRKRRLVVDTDKEFTGQQIKSQFDDFKDLLQPKCFPPPTKKAMMWKEMAGCDQLYSHPTAPGLDQELRRLLTRNYNVDIPGEPSKENAFELDNITIDQTKDSIASNDLSDIEKARTSQIQSAVTSTMNISTLQEPPDASTDNLLDPLAGAEGLDLVHADQSRENGGILQGQVQDSLLTNEFGDLGVGDLGIGDLGAPGDEIPDMSGVGDMAGELDDAQGQSLEQQSNELSEEFEQRRWTKRTQQVLHVLQRNLGNTDQVLFSSLTHKCNRKQAASRFYTCLLLAKEGMVSIHQPEPYADIQLTRGPKYTEV